MEKYRELIVTLIKNHRRYPGCENIIDEIVEEVNSKAATVVENVADETTVRNYLIKAVSTAMVIVPKRHNISTRMIRRTDVDDLSLLNSLEKDSNLSSDTEYEALPVIEEEEKEKVKEYVVDNDDEAAENTNTLNQEIEQYFNPNEDESFTIQDYIEEEPIIDEDINDEFIDNTAINEDSSVASDNSEMADISFDNTLVDRMINEIEPEDTGIIPPESYDSEFEEIDELLTEEDINDSLKQSEDLNQDLLEDNEYADLNTDVQDEQKVEYTTPDFSIFNHVQEESKIDVTEFKDDLIKLFNDNPDKKYDIIWKLKYIENKSIAEISNILDIEPDVILSGLDEIMGLIEG